jgi:STE24 endopeptidase
MWNAYAFGVLRKKRRIFVSEDLLRLLTPDEIHAVLCHEVGHHHRRHILLRTALLGFACVVPAVVLAAAGFLSPNTSAAGPLLFLGLLSWLWRRQERDADRFAAGHASAAALGAGLAKMTRARMLPAGERGGETHPSLDERLRALGLPVSAPAPAAAAAADAPRA